VPRRGASLGFSRELSWEGDKVALERGDRIAAYTDGLVDVPSGVGASAIDSVLLSCSAVEAFAPAVLAAAKQRAAAAAFVDDATLVSVLLR
jgi:serine phosphatase RsbU (regulator of sigma subunit)